MMAVECPRSGPPEALRLTQVERPTPRADEVVWSSYVDDHEHGTGAGGPLRGVVGAGRITAVIDRTCLLDRAGAAPGCVLTRRARARVVVTVGDATP